MQLPVDIWWWWGQNSGTKQRTPPVSCPRHTWTWSSWGLPIWPWPTCINLSLHCFLFHDLLYGLPTQFCNYNFILFGLRVRAINLFNLPSDRKSQPLAWRISLWAPKGVASQWYQGSCCLRIFLKALSLLIRGSFPEKPFFSTWISYCSIFSSKPLFLHLCSTDFFLHLF